MPVIPRPYVYPPTAMYTVGQYLDRVANKCYSTYTSTRDVWMIGKYLGAFFYYLYQQFKSSASFCYKVDSIIRDLLSWVYGLVNGISFYKLAEWFSRHLINIRYNAVSWVKQQFERISSTAWQLLNNPSTWLRGSIYSIVSWFRSFLSNPLLWVLNLIRSRYYWWVNFLNRPATVVVEWVLSKLRFLWEIRANAKEWIIQRLAQGRGWFRTFLSNQRAWIRALLASFNAALPAFLNNPSRYIQDIIRAVLGIPWSALSDLPFWIFDKILTRFSSYVERRKNRVMTALVDLILKFI